MAAGTEIANAYISLQTKMPGVQKDIASALGGVDTTGAANQIGSGFNSALAGAVGGAVATITAQAIDKIGQSIGAAVGRVDTMNNFPKVMENLGYSADDAEASIQAMSDGLQGLPTSLDQMAGVVQQLAPLTGGLDEATDLSLALNNALLAGGKSTDLQANAMEQYSQMLATGKVDMAAWRSMITAMPGQMSQLSEELLGTGASAFDLYDALQTGTLGFDDLNDAILNLNSEGTGEFASFADQAASATGGIETSATNLETAVTRGLAEIIGKFQPQITAAMTTVTDITNGAFTALSGAIDWLIANGDLVIPVIAGIGTVLLVALAPALWAAVAATWAFTVALLANPLTWIILAIGALVAAIVWLAMNWDEVVAWVSDVWSGFIGWITDVIDGFVGWWNEVWAGISSGWESMWNGIGDFLKGVWNNILGWIEGGVNGAIDLINGMMGGIRDVAGFIGIEVGEIPHVNIPRLADGGVVSRRRGGTLAVVGEGRYDEAVVPLSPQVLAQMGGGGAGGANIHVDVNGTGMDEATVGNIIGYKVADVLRTAG